VKLYVAASYEDKRHAESVAKELESAGHQVVSDWHRKEERGELTSHDKATIAFKDATQVTQSDGVVLLEASHPVTGGKFVEAGICIGLGRPVFLRGEPENMLMYHPNVFECPDTKAVLYAIEDFINIGKAND
jgi:nucleoside 2-deoxyribosyltransferase